MSCTYLAASRRQRQTGREWLYSSLSSLLCTDGNQGHLHIRSKLGAVWEIWSVGHPKGHRRLMTKFTDWVWPGPIFINILILRIFLFLIFKIFNALKSLLLHIVILSFWKVRYVDVIRIKFYTWSSLNALIIRKIRKFSMTKQNSKKIERTRILVNTSPGLCKTRLLEQYAYKTKCYFIFLLHRSRQNKVLSLSQKNYYVLGHRVKLQSRSLYDQWCCTTSSC